MDQIKNPITKRNLIAFYVSHQKENSVSVKTEDKDCQRIKLFRTNSPDGKIVNQNSYIWTLKPEKDIITGRKNPGYEPASFVDNSNAVLPITNRKISDVTIKLDSDSIIKWIRNKKTGMNFPKKVANKITRGELNNWLIELATVGDIPLTITAAKPGDSATFYVTPVHGEYFDLLLPKDLVKAAIEGSNLPEKTNLKSGCLKSSKVTIYFTFNICNTPNALQPT